MPISPGTDFRSRGPPLRSLRSLSPTPASYSAGLAGPAHPLVRFGERTGGGRDGDGIGWAAAHSARGAGSAAFVYAAAALVGSRQGGALLRSVGPDRAVRARPG